MKPIPSSSFLLGDWLAALMTAGVALVIAAVIKRLDVLNPIGFRLSQRFFCCCGCT